MPEQPTILDTILAHKQTELAERKARLRESELKTRIASLGPTRDFLGALQTPKIGPVALIAEVKKASPSAGVIRAEFDPVQFARIYEMCGAACLSVLTDERFFQGHDDFLAAIREAVSVPLLRKDFTVDAYQIYEARALGADAILLIVAALTPTQVGDYLSLAQELGLAALVEVHTEEEMDTARAAGAKLIGINSRDLKTFVTDLSAVARLGARAPADVTLVAESGLKTAADVTRVAQAGAKAILVGETLMRAPDIGLAVTELLGTV